MPPSRDVRAQFYSRMGLVATTAAQPSQSIKEEPVPRPSCSSSAEDEENSKERAKHGSDKEINGTKIGLDSDERLAIDSPGSFFELLPGCLASHATRCQLNSH